jgi:hypothetical protein
MSGIATLLVVASFVVPALALGWGERFEGEGDPDAAFWAWMFAFYIVQYFVIFFFNAALVGAALIRLGGGDPTVNDGLRIATSRIGAIFGYAVIAATVGLVLRMLEERLAFVGRLVVGALGIAWTVTTFLTVPVLVTRDVGAVEAVRESATLLRRSWGENVIGNAGISLAFMVIWAGLFVAGFAVVMGPALATESAALALVLGGGVVLVAALAALVQAALQGVYSAALYRYATEGSAGGGFDGNVLADAFRARS